jgi:hypothetical protein
MSRGILSPLKAAATFSRAGKSRQPIGTTATVAVVVQRAAGLQIGFPEGVNVWLDLEGPKSRTPHETMIAYCNAWFAEVESAGFVPGVYVGAGGILSGNELFWRLTTKHYSKSGSGVPDIPHRGYQLIQTIIRNDKIDGIAIDRNLTKNDEFGGSVLWLSES